MAVRSSQQRQRTGLIFDSVVPPPFSYVVVMDFERLKLRGKLQLPVDPQGLLRAEQEPGSSTCAPISS